jgi:mono/diheme cytochrome c family protein
MLVALSASAKGLLFICFMVLVPLVPVTALLSRRLPDDEREIEAGRSDATPFRLITWVSVGVLSVAFAVLAITFGVQWLVSRDNDDSVDPRNGGAAAGIDPPKQALAQGNADRGRAVFRRSGCGGCHTLADADANGTRGPSLDADMPDFTRVVECVTTGPGDMPSFTQQLTGAQIRDVAAYVSSRAGTG